MPSHEVAAAALTMLPAMGPTRLRGLLRRADPLDVWLDLVAGQDLDRLRESAAVSADTMAAWSSGARRLDLTEIESNHVSADVAIGWCRGLSFPTILQTDPEPPAVIFTQGALGDLLELPRVAVVGTRSCTRYGFDVARELGTRLAEAGVVVVSGLALGIDAAAHAGALAADAAPVLGIVGSGLDVIYPSANAGLWAQVRLKGALVSEAPLGARPQRWRFPARNRIIAALADLVIVVESHLRGGSLSTAEEALDRGIGVMAVPGSVLSPASLGSNRLIADGAAPAISAADVLELLQIGAAPGAVAFAHAAHAALHPDVLELFGSEPLSFDTLAERSPLDSGQLALAIEELVEAGLIERRGFFYERVSPSGSSRGHRVAET